MQLGFIYSNKNGNFSTFLHLIRVPIRAKYLMLATVGQSDGLFDTQAQLQISDSHIEHTSNKQCYSQSKVDGE